MIHVIKAILIVFSASLFVKTLDKDDKTLSIYWCFVMLYWIVNLMQGIL